MKLLIKNKEKQGFNGTSKHISPTILYYYDERFFKSLADNQSEIDLEVYRARSLMDKAPLWLGGRYGFEAFRNKISDSHRKSEDFRDFAKIPPRLHLFPINNINSSNKIKEKQARSLDKTHWLRGILHYDNYNDNNYLKVSFMKILTSHKQVKKWQ